MSRVLIVDDNDVIAKLLARSLSDAGHETVQVSGHPEELINPSSELWLGADVLVCDLRMPTLSGYELLAVALTYFPNIRRIVFTGLSPYDTEVTDAAKLADRVLFKPADALRVAEVVEELVR